MSDQKKRHLRQLADSYYDKAMQQYQQMECAAEGLRVQLERLALLEFTLAGTTLLTEEQIRSVFDDN